jgi:hypothetical protein
MKMAVFWVVTPCSLVDVYRRFRDVCCLYHQGGKHLPDYTAQRPRRQPSSYSPPWEHQISNGIAWLKAAIWNLKGIKRGSDKGRYPLCLGDEDGKPINMSLKCMGTKRWKDKFWCNKWLRVDEDLALKIIDCTNVIGVKNIGKYVYEVMRKRENKIGKMELMD